MDRISALERRAQEAALSCPCDNIGINYYSWDRFSKELYLLNLVLDIPI